MVPLNLGKRQGLGDETPGPPPQKVTDDMFEEFLKTGNAGSKLCYHEGYLPKDRRQPATRGEAPPPTPDQLRVEEVARHAWRAAAKRRVELTQKKLGKLNYQYFATIRHGY